MSGSCLHMRFDPLSHSLSSHVKNPFDSCAGYMGYPFHSMCAVDELDPILFLLIHIMGKVFGSVAKNFKLSNKMCILKS